MKGKTWIRWMLYWIFWTVLGLLNAATQIIQNPGAPTWKPLLWELSSLYTVGALYPLVAYLSRRFPVSKRVNIAAHIVFLIAFSAAHTSGMVSVRKIGYWLVGETYMLSPIVTG